MPEDLVLLADDVFTNYFPDAKSKNVLVDASLLLNNDWHSIATDVWQTPKEIFDKLVSNNLTFDCFASLHKKYGDDIHLLFDCSTRDGDLAKVQNYFDDGIMDVDEKQVQEELDKQEDEVLPEELTQDTKKMFENSDDEVNQNVTGFHQQSIDDYPEVTEVRDSSNDEGNNPETEKNSTENDEGEEKNMEQTVKTEAQTIDIEGQTFTQNELENGYKFKGKRFDKCKFKDIKISEYLPTGAPFSECTFENVVFDVAVANMQFANCTFSNVLFTKMVKNVLFEGCSINFSSEQMKEVFTACSYIASEEKRDETVENIICGEPRVKELTEEEKQVLIKEEVEKRVGEEKKTAYDEGMKAGIESVQEESESISLENLVKTIRNIAECNKTFSECTHDLITEAGILIEKEADKHKTIEKEVVREMTEEEKKDMVIRYINENINQVGELITSAQNYKPEESKKTESEQGFGRREDR